MQPQGTHLRRPASDCDRKRVHDAALMVHHAGAINKKTWNYLSHWAQGARRRLPRPAYYHFLETMRQAKTNIPKATRQMLRTTTQKERRSNLRFVRRILSQWKKTEEKPPEGCNQDPKPVTPKPGAAQLWLAGLKTKEEGEKKKNISNIMKCAMALLRALAV